LGAIASIKEIPQGYFKKIPKFPVLFALKNHPKKDLKSGLKKFSKSGFWR
jgi:hypothetical protein